MIYIPYVMRTNKMHNFVHYCFNLIIVSSTCFEHPSVHPQEDLNMQFYGIACMHPYKQSGSRDSVDGIATRYGLEGPGIESQWGEIFHTYPERLRGPPSLLYNGYRVFPGSKGGRDVMLTAHPLLVPRLRKS